MKLIRIAHSSLTVVSVLVLLRGSRSCLWRFSCFEHRLVSSPWQSCVSVCTRVVAQCLGAVQHHSDGSLVPHTRLGSAHLSAVHSNLIPFAEFAFFSVSLCPPVRRYHRVEWSVRSRRVLPVGSFLCVCDCLAPVLRCSDCVRHTEHTEPALHHHTRHTTDHHPSRQHHSQSHHLCVISLHCHHSS